MTLESEELSALGEQVGESLCGCWTVKQLPETVTLTKMDGTAAPDVGVTAAKFKKIKNKREGERYEGSRDSPAGLLQKQ